MTAPNNVNQESCFEHKAQLRILEHKVQTIEGHFKTLIERTELINGMAMTLENIDEKLDAVCEDFTKHKDNQETEEEKVITQLAGINIRLIEAGADRTSTKTKTDILWYIVIVVLLGAILTKMLIPALGF
jgi:hypothetical protein